VGVVEWSTWIAWMADLLYWNGHVRATFTNKP
jgi:hypothetical protein